MKNLYQASFTVMEGDNYAGGAVTHTEFFESITEVPKDAFDISKLRISETTKILPLEFTNTRNTLLRIAEIRYNIKALSESRKLLIEGAEADYSKIRLLEVELRDFEEGLR